MNRDLLGAIVRYVPWGKREPRVMRVVGLLSGSGTGVVLHPVDARPCEACGSIGEVVVVEGSQQWRECVRPVQTIEGTPDPTG